VGCNDLATDRVPVEVIPPPTEDDAELRVTFEQGAEPVMLGCRLLDPEQEFCSVDAGIEAGGAYMVSITIQDVNRAECVLTAE
jgi:hypothetical protein